ncbi:TM1812 family CRISPR-associated protein [Nostoc sp.]|uniref:TM1812 family CRISPR-associated protein n=1 Tax=Nostoc sp. TaxID=1180 RepID=UPI003FA59C28
MLDWLTATERFVEIGDGQALANLLKSAIPSGIELRDNVGSRPLRSQLNKAAEAIESISLALNVTRPIETMKSATQLEETLKQAALSFAQRAKPFSLRTDKIASTWATILARREMGESLLYPKI